MKVNSMLTKLILIHFADVVDNYILRHKIYYVCNKIGGSNWWGDHMHRCFYCRKFGVDSDLA